jgi:hypothetical protein
MNNDAKTTAILVVVTIAAMIACLLVQWYTGVPVIPPIAT